MASRVGLREEFLEEVMGKEARGDRHMNFLFLLHDFESVSI